MRANSLGAKPNKIEDTIRNVKTTGDISKGMPVILALNATDDGMGVFLPSDGDAGHNNAFFYGVSGDDLSPNEIGHAVRSGYCRFAILQRQTRPTSTDTWQTEVTWPKGTPLTIDSVNNRFITTVSSATQASNAAVSLSSNNVKVLLAQTLASYTSSASATSDTRTAITAAIAVFLRDL